MRRIRLSGFHVAGGLGLAMFLAGCAATQQASQSHVSASPQLPAVHAGHAAEGPQATAQDAWARLKAGNARFVDNRQEHPDQTPLRRSELTKGQHPFAVVLTCSDSRVPPEVLFDTGLGDIFVIRVAGNTADDAVIGSIEYAVEHLHAPLVVVLGHERCGAVQAAVQAAQKHEALPGHIGAIVNPIVPAVTAVAEQGGDVAENAMRTNVLSVVKQIKASKPILAEAIHEHKLSVIGARYDLDSGEVTTVEQPHMVSAGH
jgi:carbonic anhydrase